MANTEEKNGSVTGPGIGLRVVYKNDLDFFGRLAACNCAVDSVGLYPNVNKIYHREYNTGPEAGLDGYDRETEAIIGLLGRHNIKAYLLLDETDPDPLIVENYGGSVLRSYLKRLIISVGLRNITVFNLPLAVKIKNDFPSVNLEISGSASVDSVEKTVRWREAVEVGGLCVPGRLNKRPKMFGHLKNKTGLKLSVVVNDCCLTDCPSRISHCNLRRHVGEYFSFFDCRPAMAERPWQVFRQGYIVPADLKHYGGIIDTAIIDGEGMTAATRGSGVPCLPRVSNTASSATAI